MKDLTSRRAANPLKWVFSSLKISKIWHHTWPRFKVLSSAPCTAQWLYSAHDREKVCNDVKTHMRSVSLRTNHLSLNHSCHAEAPWVECEMLFEGECADFQTCVEQFGGWETICCCCGSEITITWSSYKRRSSSLQWNGSFWKQFRQSSWP